MMAFPVQTKYLSTILLLILIGIVFTALPVTGDNVNDDEELDPFDMVNFDHVSMKMKKKAQPSGKSSHKEMHTPSAEEQRKDSSPSAEMKKAGTTSGHREEDKTPDITEPGKEGKTPDVTKSGKEDRTQPVTELPKLKPEKCAPEVCPSPRDSCPALYLFQRFVTDLLKLIQGKIWQLDGKTDLCVRFRLTPHHVEILEQFKEDHTKNRVFRVHEILTEALQGASIVHDGHFVHSLWFEERLGMPVEKVVQVFICGVLLVAFTLLLSKLRFSRNLIYWAVFLGFSLSVATTWLRLYKGEVAKQHEAMFKNPPRGCAEVPESDGFFGNIANMIKYSFTFQQDACVEYYEHLLVDPIVKVSITEAFAVAVVQTFLKPMRTIGTELSNFMRALLKDLPVQWQLISIIAVFVFIVLVLFLSCGYRIRIPFFLAIEPSQQPSTGNNEGEMRSLRQEISHLQARVEGLGASAPSAHQPTALPQASSSKPALPQSLHKGTAQPQTNQACSMPVTQRHHHPEAQAPSLKPALPQPSHEDTVQPQTNQGKAAQQPCSCSCSAPVTKRHHPPQAQASSLKPTLPQPSHEDTVTQGKGMQPSSCSFAASITKRLADQVPDTVGSLSESSCSSGLQSGETCLGEHGRENDFQATQSLPLQNHSALAEPASNGAAVSCDTGDTGGPRAQREDSSASSVECMSELQGSPPAMRQPAEHEVKGIKA